MFDRTADKSLSRNKHPHGSDEWFAHERLPFEALREVEREVQARVDTEPRKTYLQYLKESQDAQKAKLAA